MNSNKEIEIYPAHLATRNLPINCSQKETWLFSNERERHINATTLLRLKKVRLYRGTIVKWNNWKIFHKYTHIFWNYRFVLERTVIASIKAFFLKPTPVIEKGIWITDEWCFMFFHWMTDSLPRLVAAEKFIDDHIVILPSRLQDCHFVKESLQYLSINHVYIDINEFYFVKELLLPSHTSPTGSPSRFALNAMKIRFESVLKVGQPPYRKLFISRSKAQNRHLSNESELIPILKAKGFEVHNMEEYPLLTQMQLFFESHTVVSMHGAGLANMIFMPHDGSILEIRNQKDDYNNCFFSMASALNLKYYFLGADPQGNEGHGANCKVDLMAFSDTIEQMEF